MEDGSPVEDGVDDGQIERWVLGLDEVPSSLLGEGLRGYEGYQGTVSAKIMGGRKRGQDRTIVNQPRARGLALLLNELNISHVPVRLRPEGQSH